MEDKKFIITTNPESAALLIKSGLKTAFDDGHSWIFYNNTKLVFNNIEGLVFSNKIFI